MYAYVCIYIYICLYVPAYVHVGMCRRVFMSTHCYDGFQMYDAHARTCMLAFHFAATGRTRARTGTLARIGLLWGGV